MIITIEGVCWETTIFKWSWNNQFLSDEGQTTSNGKLWIWIFRINENVSAVIGIWDSARRSKKNTHFNGNCLGQQQNKMKRQCQRVIWLLVLMTALSFLVCMLVWYRQRTIHCSFNDSVPCHHSQHNYQWRQQPNR